MRTAWQQSIIDTAGTFTSAGADIEQTCCKIKKLAPFATRGGKLMGLGSRVKEAREAKGLSKADLARVLEVSSTAVYNWESLDMRPRGQTLSSLCRVLGTTEEWVVDGVKSTTQAIPNRTANDIINEAKEALSGIMGVPAERIKLRLELD